MEVNEKIINYTDALAENRSSKLIGPNDAAGNSCGKSTCTVCPKNHVPAIL